MKKSVLFAVVVLISAISYGQEVGEIFNSCDIQNLFGDVKQSVKFEADELRSLLTYSGDHIMFRIINGDIVILDQYRNKIYPLDKEISFDDETVFKFFSISVVERLLNSSTERYIYFEEREKALVVKFNNKTMERGGLCPPYCDKTRGLFAFN